MTGRFIFPSTRASTRAPPPRPRRPRGRPLSLALDAVEDGEDPDGLDAEARLLLHLADQRPDNQLAPGP